jgi:hypothetical protein
MWYGRKTSNLTSSRTTTNLKGKESFMARTRSHTQPTSRGRMIRRKAFSTFVVILIIGLLTAQISMTSVGAAARLQMLLLVVILR